MQMGTGSWLDGLSGRLPRHALLLRRLVELARSDERVRLLEIQCSVARGTADELSDLDVGIWVKEPAFEAFIEQVLQWLAPLGPIQEPLVHRMPDWSHIAHRHIFAIFSGGLQLDAVAVPVSEYRGRVPGAVVLYDPEGLSVTQYEPPARTATRAQMLEWEQLARIALANVDKYIRRGSLWEATQQLEDARRMLLQVHAVTKGVEYPSFGLTAILDAQVALPEGLEETIAGPDHAALTRARRALGAILDRVVVASHQVGRDPDLEELQRPPVAPSVSGRGDR